MSDKQNAFITRLVGERYKGLGAESMAAAVAGIPMASMTTSQKSELIDRLLALPVDPDPEMPAHVAEASRTGRNDSPGTCDSCGWPVGVHEGYFYGPHPDGKRWKVHHKVGECNESPAPQPIEVREGIYTGPGGEIIQAYRTKNGRIGGKVWDGARFNYQKGAVHLAGLGHRITAEEAKAFGLTTERCVFCSQSLTDGRSKDVGYGPVCADNNGLPWG
jgi:hypothetical protein